MITVILLTLTLTGCKSNKGQLIEISDDEFVKAVSDIRCQIDTVQSNPEGFDVHTDDILSKVEQTKQTSEGLVDIAHTNEQNAISIQQIMERFSISR